MRAELARDWERERETLSYHGASSGPRGPLQDLFEAAIYEARLEGFNLSG